MSILHRIGTRVFNRFIRVTPAVLSPQSSIIEEDDDGKQEDSDEKEPVVEEKLVDERKVLTDAAVISKMTDTLRWIRDTILSGKVVSFDGTLSKWALPEIVNRCDFALSHNPNKCYGSIVKMRRTLWRLRDFYLSGPPGRESVVLSGRNYFDVHGMINEALCEPVRNCEIYHDFDTANKVYMASHKKHPSIRDFVYWLLNGTVCNAKNEANYENFDRSALRRALQEVYKAMNDKELLPRTSGADGDSKIKTIVEAALAKPQRNCDRYFTKKDAELAYKAMVNDFEEKSKTPPAFEDWLYMEA